MNNNNEFRMIESFQHFVVYSIFAKQTKCENCLFVSFFCALSRLCEIGVEKENGVGHLRCDAPFNFLVQTRNGC